MPTLQEVVDLARRSRTCDGKPVGIYPETKHPSYFDEIGLSLEEPLVRTLHRNGFHGHRAPVIIQSFELRSSADPNAPGNMAAEVSAFTGFGMDGYFTDNPGLGLL